jgi:cysteine desulfuration protein SufE
MKSIEAKQQELISDFEELEDWRERYRAIIEFGEELAPLPPEFRHDKYLVKECQNRVWLGALQKADSSVEYFADGESQIVKGLAALLINLYSGHTADEILNTPAEFVQALRLGENLTRNRTNGLAALVSRIKRFALQFQLEAAHAIPPRQD